MRRRLRIWPTTQRVRLAVYASIIAAVLLGLVFGAALYWNERSVVHGSWHVLKQAAASAADIYERNPRDPDWNRVLSPDPEISIAVFDADGELTKQAGSLDLRPVDGHGIAQFGSVTASFFTLDDRQGNHLVLAIPWSRINHALERQRLFLALLYLPLVFGTGFATWIASRSTFRPLADLAEQAEQLSATDLARRLTLDGSDEYAELAAHLNRFLDLLEASVQRQERFVADAAHELRTPLTVLRGQIETTLLLPREREEYVKRLGVLLGEAERLSRLVEGLLLSARSGEAPAVAPIDAGICLERAEARWLDRFSAAGVRLELVGEGPSYVRLAPEECDSILDNLLSNALKHSAPGTTTRLELRPAGEEVRFEVVDEGSGIPPELRSKIFERFVRGDVSRNRESGGFGVGLSVVRRIVEARGGRVELAPSERGARFEVSLPAAR